MVVSLLLYTNVGSVDSIKIGRVQVSVQLNVLLVFVCSEGAHIYLSSTGNNYHEKFAAGEYFCPDAPSIFFPPPSLRLGSNTVLPYCYDRIGLHL